MPPDQAQSLIESGLTPTINLLESDGEAVEGSDPSVSEETREVGGDLDESDGPENTPADVLVVDDNALNRAAILRLLRKAGIVAIATDSAIGATRIAVRCQVGVVVADLNMPAMQGSSLLQVFRRNPRLRHVGMVLLSGVSAQELVSAASEVGADAAIAKIEMASTLVPVVNRLLRRAARPGQVSGKFSLLPSILATKTLAGDG
jgi:PleD family two-component response regulator